MNWQPMKQKREELSGREMQGRLPLLDQDVDLLGQKPEGMGLLQASALVRVGRTIQMLSHAQGRWRVGQVNAGVQGEQVPEQGIQQQVTCTVGEGGHPLLHRGGGRSAVILRPHLAHQLSPAQTSEKIERNHLLKQRDDKMPMGVKKVGQQAVRAATGLAAYSLDAEPVVDFSGECPTLVGAPADQRTPCPAVGVRAALRYGERAALGENCGDVFFDGTEKRLYNDHELGTPPLVVWPPSRDPRREVSSFLLKVPAIISIAAGSVKPEQSPGPCQPLLERAINVTRRLVSSRHPSRPIIYSGPKRLYSDHSMWPVTPARARIASLDKSGNMAYHTIDG
jgi:hypothetical protein